MHPSRQLAATLRKTLRTVELSAATNPDDPSLPVLRRVLTEKIADLEAEAARFEAGKDRPPYGA
jgi:hypothetical protein